MVKSRRTGTELTDANRRESRQKTGKEGAKREAKGTREGPTSRARLSQNDLFPLLNIVESALPAILCIAESALLIN